MIFTILTDVFEDNSATNIKILDKIFLTTSDRHRLYLSDEDTISVLKNSDWYKELRNSYQKEIEEYIVSSAQSAKPKNVFPVISNIETSNFSPEEALVILEKELKLILENSENDAFFIKSLMKNFKKKSKKINKHLSEGWLSFSMGGGSTIPNVIRSEKQWFENNKDKFPKESYVYLRCFVLIDSDKAYPNALIEAKQNWIKFFKENHVQYHILAKREIENYMPDIVFDTIQNNREYIDAYLALSAIQKDYFDIEKGFNNKNYKQLPLDIQDLYSAIPDRHKEILRKGLDMDKFKSEFPKLFLDERVNNENLQERCGTNELQDILDKITDLL
jgi:hypothetical protein